MKNQKTIIAKIVAYFQQKKQLEIITEREYSRLIKLTSKINFQ